MAQHEQIHASQFPGSMVGQIFADQMEVTIRHHALEAGCFVVNATGWLTDEQVAADHARPGHAEGACAAGAAPRSSRRRAYTFARRSARAKGWRWRTWTSR